MKSSDTRSLISVLYTLALLFIGAIYFQKDYLSDPGTISQLQQMNGNETIDAFAKFQLSGDSVLLTVITLTVLFSFVFLMGRSNS